MNLKNDSAFETHLFSAVMEQASESRLSVSASNEFFAHYDRSVMIVLTTALCTGESIKFTKAL